MKGVTWMTGKKKEEEEERKRREEKRNPCGRTCRRADQPKVVQEVLADLKTIEWCLPDSKKCDSLGEIFEY